MERAAKGWRITMPGEERIRGMWVSCKSRTLSKRDGGIQRRGEGNIVANWSAPMVKTVTADNNDRT